MNDIKSLLQQQIAYYQARATEYDEWFLRQGRYDRGPEWNRQWFSEVEQVLNFLDQNMLEGNLLELACGTGLWTQQLLSHARRITAIDAAVETLELNRQRLQSSKVEYIQADIFSWQPQEQYDGIVFCFWLSHVPEQYFEKFWGKLKQWLKPGGRVFFLDSKLEPTSTAIDQHLGEVQTGIVKRRLNNGQEYDIVKIFYKKEQLEKKLNQLGWRLKVRDTPHYFLYGYGGVG